MINKLLFISIVSLVSYNQQDIDKCISLKQKSLKFRIIVVKVRFHPSLGEFSQSELRFTSNKDDD